MLIRVNEEVSSNGTHMTKMVREKSTLDNASDNKSTTEIVKTTMENVKRKKLQFDKDLR